MNAKTKLDISSAALLLVLALLGWEVGVRLSRTPVYLLPAPSRIWATFWLDPLYYLQALWVTLGEAVGGLTLGLLAGIGVAVWVTLQPRLEGGVMTLALLIKSMPLAAIAPLLTIWLGFGVLPKVIITALLTFFPVLVNTLVGLQSADAEMLDLLRVHRATAWQTLRHLRAWLALPYLFAALRVAAPLSLMGAVIAEWTGAGSGLGRVMWLAYANLNLPPLFAAIFVVSTVSIFIYLLMVWLEHKAMPWRTPSVD
ncbi:MAG: nitrate ABC transporter permease [Anaerolineae bacterium]|jgi:ABC-type nitrate/sulfonate/bicarbonate transport system permease component|nr:MAG: nitrate ABC transporter permease [Anaerolineae bacterium]